MRFHSPLHSSLYSPPTAAHACTAPRQPWNSPSRARRYAPGHVPQWLDKQAHRGTAPVESHSPRAGGSEGDTAVEAEAAEGRASAAVLHAEHRRAASVDEHAAADDEHDGHRWLLLTMSGVSIALIVLWLARWLRIGFGRPRKRRAGEANFPFDSFRGFDTSHRF